MSVQFSSAISALGALVGLTRDPLAPSADPSVSPAVEASSGHPDGGSAVLLLLALGLVVAALRRVVTAFSALARALVEVARLMAQAGVAVGGVMVPLVGIAVIVIFLLSRTAASSPG